MKGPIWWYRWCRRARYSRRQAFHIARNWHRIERVEAVDAETGRVYQRAKP